MPAHAHTQLPDPEEVANARARAEARHAEMQKLALAKAPSMKQQQQQARSTSVAIVSLLLLIGCLGRQGTRLAGGGSGRGTWLAWPSLCSLAFWCGARGPSHEVRGSSAFITAYCLARLLLLHRLSYSVQTGENGLRRG